MTKKKQTTKRCEICEYGESGDKYTECHRQSPVKLESDSLTSSWPSVNHYDSCGEFKLRCYWEKKYCSGDYCIYAVDWVIWQVLVVRVSHFFLPKGLRLQVTHSRKRCKLGIKKCCLNKKQLFCIQKFCHVCDGWFCDGCFCKPKIK